MTEHIAEPVIEHLEFSIEAKSENLRQVFDFVTAKLEAIGCEKKTIRQCKLCTEEIFLNISSHAYNPTTGNVDITLDILGDPESNNTRAVLTFADTGKPFNPLEKEDPDVDAPLEERQVGGLGIYLVKEVMDGVSYSYRDGHNILVMEKKIEGV